MIHRTELHKFDARYHRNGIAGESFYVCRFTMRNGQAVDNYQAIVFDAPDHVAVTSQVWGARFRGDEFEKPLREALSELERIRPGTLHVHD